MARVNLTGGSYAARSQTAAAQTCLNLFPEPIPAGQDETIQYAHLLTPGEMPFCQLPQSEVRCLYTTSLGDMIAVSGSTVYHVDTGGNSTALGQITSTTGLVRMQDNGLCIVIVDGTANGWTVAMPAPGVTSYGPVTAITDPAWYGSATVAYLDTFLLCVEPGGKQWYVLPSNYENGVALDPLYVASKTSYPDIIVGVAVIGQTIWIFGQQSTELWYDAGATDFPFQRQQGVLANVGCDSPYSIATNFGQVFWVGRDVSGHARVYIGADNQAEVISTFAIEHVLGEQTLQNAIGSCYQQEGHVFYVMTLQNATYVYDASTQLWHQRATGLTGRLAANCWCSVYGRTYCGDYQNGLVSVVSQDFGLENGAPIYRQRAFPHVMTDGKRARHLAFGLDMQGGTTIEVDIDWSDDRGLTFAPPVPLNLTPMFAKIWNTGISRDRVYRVTWTDAQPTALLGAFIDIQALAS